MSDRTIPDDVMPQVDWARGTKNGVVERAEPGENDDIRPMVEVKRGDTVIGVINCRDINRDEALQAVNIAVPGWSADYVCMLLDAHAADQKFIDKYGRMPDPLELQDLCDKEGACEIGLITDCIVVAEAWRGGRQRLTSLPYHVHHSTSEAPGRVCWNALDDERTYSIDTDQLDGRLTGMITDSLRYAFERPKLEDALAEEGLKFQDFELEETTARIHMDLAVLHVLTGGGYAVMMNASTPLHQEMLDEFATRTAGVVTFDHDGVERRSTAEPGLLDIANMGMREKLEEDRRLAHEEDVAERKRRQAERAKGDKKETTEDVVDRLMGRA